VDLLAIILSLYERDRLSLSPSRQGSERSFGSFLIIGAHTLEHQTQRSFPVSLGGSLPPIRLSRMKMQMSDMKLFNSFSSAWSSNNFQVLLPINCRIDEAFLSNLQQQNHPSTDKRNS
jgi:hypothetical protein